MPPIYQKQSRGFKKQSITKTNRGDLKEHKAKAMARNSNTAVFVALVAALVISTASAVTHQVGDGIGWNVPPGGAVAYSTWSSNNTFKAGDTLGKPKNAYIVLFMFNNHSSYLKET